MRNDAPKDEVEQFREARKPLPASFLSTVQQWDTTMNQGEFEETVQAARVSNRVFGSQDWQEFTFLQNATPAEIDARIYELILTEQDENGQTPLPSLEYPAPHLVLQKKVEEFARSHMFIVNKNIKPTTLQRREFTRDIYDYARAIGMGKHQANVEVKRARAAYRRDRGLTRGLALDDSDDESTLGLEINDAAEYITSMKNGMQRGPVDPAGAWKEITRLQARSVHSDSPMRKRKHDMLDTHTVNRAFVAAEQTTGDANVKTLKKHKRRRLKQLYSNGVDRRPAELAETPSVSKSRKERKMAMRQKHSTLIKSEDPSPANTISKSTPTTHPEARHIGKAGSETKYNKKVAAEDEEPLRLRPTKNPNFENSPNNDQHFHNDTGVDLRKRKKKKRKRKSLGAATEIAGPSDAKAQAEPDNNNININSVQPSKGPPDIGHVQEEGRTTAEHERKRVKEDTADDNGIAKPLSELMPTNSNKRMQGRRDRGTKRKAATAIPKPSTFAANEAVKDHHS